MSRSCSVAVGGSGVDAWTEFSVVIAANICSTAFPTSTSSCTCNTTGQLCFNQTGRQGLYVFCLSVRPLVLLPDLCEINSFLCKLGRGPRGKGKKLIVRGLGGQGHATFLIALVWVAFTFTHRRFLQGRWADSAPYLWQKCHHRNHPKKCCP